MAITEDQINEIHETIDRAIFGKSNDDCKEILDEFVSFASDLRESFGE